MSASDKVTVATAYSDALFNGLGSKAINNENKSLRSINKGLLLSLSDAESQITQLAALVGKPQDNIADAKAKLETIKSIFSEVICDCCDCDMCDLIRKTRKAIEGEK